MRRQSSSEELGHLCGEGVVAMAVWLRRGIDAIGKYIEDKGSQISHCQRRELQIWKGGKFRMNPLVRDWN